MQVSSVATGVHRGARAPNHSPAGSWKLPKSEEKHCGWGVGYVIILAKHCGEQLCLNSELDLQSQSASALTAAAADVVRKPTVKLCV